MPGLLDKVLLNLNFEETLCHKQGVFLCAGINIRVLVFIFTTPDGLYTIYVGAGLALPSLRGCSKQHPYGKIKAKPRMFKEWMQQQKNERTRARTYE